MTVLLCVPCVCAVKKVRRLLLCVRAHAKYPKCLSRCTSTTHFNRMVILLCSADVILDLQYIMWTINVDEVQCIMHVEALLHYKRRICYAYQIYDVAITPEKTATR